jgi:hypothetical protein
VGWTEVHEHEQEVLRGGWWTKNRSLSCVTMVESLRNGDVKLTVNSTELIGPW